MVIAVNKWDGLPPEQRDTVRRQLELKLPFVEYAPVQFISALHGTGVGDLFGLVVPAMRRPTATCRRRS
jgi:GTPase